MSRNPLFQRRSGMTASFILMIIVGVQSTYTPSCEDLSESNISLVKVTSWSSCTKIDETDGSRPGCYSGRQERLVQFATNSSNELSIGKLIRCSEYRRCLVPGRICEGVWGLWEESTCNCSTKAKTQIRYCYTRQQETASPPSEVRSIHCLGSFGRSYSKRTSSCKPDKNDCKPVERTKLMKPTEEPITTDGPTSSLVTSVFSDITSNRVILNSTTKIRQSNVQLTITTSLGIGHFVAIAGGGILTILLIILAIHFWHRRRMKRLEKQDRRISVTNSQHTEELAERSRNDERCYARNDLYHDSVNNGERERDLPLPNDADVVVSISDDPPASSTSQMNAYTPTTNGVQDEESIYWSIVT